MIKSVKLFGLVWKVRVAKIPGYAEADAYFDADKRELVVDEKHTDDDALLHEILHVIAETLGVPLEEQHVRLLGVALFQVLRDNPGLAAQVMGVEVDE